MRILPPGGEVDWPAGEGAVGVVGVAPWATLDFCRKLFGLVEATKDWHYPRVIADFNSKIPSRGRHLQLGEADPSPAIRRTLAELHAQGATVGVVPCNTAHLLHDRWAAGSPMPIVHVWDVSVDAIERGPVAVLASGTLARSGALAERVRAVGLEVVGIGDLQSGVDAAIEAVKLGRAEDPSVRGGFAELLGQLEGRGARAALLACTELPLLTAGHEGLQVVDSSLELARAALAAL